MKRYRLKNAVHDMMFDTGNGREFCHSTGYEVYFAGDGYWLEYEDKEGNLYYGR